MKQEEKELLLKDLSARLLYGVSVQIEGFAQAYEVIGMQSEWVIITTEVGDDRYHISKVRPYLRPMSSMTTKEELELDHIAATCESYPVLEIGIRLAEFISDFCNRRHFDYRGLILKGLALEAPKNMYQI